ncbi:MAG: TetR/AcrR family transcriptional regulator [Antricoccus sp.]
MPSPVNPRRYHAPRRQKAAQQTRSRIIAAARELFTHNGYEQTAVSAIANLAEVSVDTIYTSIGRKPALVRAVIDDVLGEGRGPVTATARGYVEQIEAAPDATTKFAEYARALGRLNPELAPLLEALHQAGLRDQECHAAWSGLVNRRAANMRLFAANLRTTGELRADLDDDTVADLVWATNSTEYYLLLTARGWSTRRYTDHLVDLWTRLLLHTG